MGRATQEAREAETSRPVQIIGRLGMSGYGVVHLVVAWLAAQVAFGCGGEADQKGAVSAIAGRGVVVLGLAAYTIKLTVSGGGSSGNEGEQDATATLLGLPAGHRGSSSRTWSSASCRRRPDTSSSCSASSATSPRGSPTA